MKNYVLLAAASFVLGACGSSGSSSVSSSKIEFTAGAVESLPQLISTSQSLTTMKAAASDYESLVSFFEQECFMPNGDNYCPAGVDTSGGDDNPRKFTPMTLLGLIYHAQMYSGGLKTTCDTESNLSAATIGTGSFVAHTTEGSDADKFILDYFDLLTCLGAANTSEGGTSTGVYSIDSTSSYQAALTARYRVPYNGEADPGQTDVFQVYTSIENSSPKILAFNFAGANTMFSRAVLLVNVTTHKFAVKYRQPGTPTHTIVAVGVGGVNRSTGVANPGYYWTRFTDNDGNEISGKCIDNSTSEIAEDASCTAAAVPVAWTSSEDIKTYLDISDTDTQRLLAFLYVFNDSEPLADGTSPTNATQGGDPELYFPASIEGS